MKKRFEYAGLFALLLLLGVSRRACQLQYPDVWDEDGIKIIPGIIRNGASSLFDPVNGYMVLVPKLLSFISLHISFSHYGLISSILTFLLIAAVALAVAASPTILLGKRWCALALFFIPSDPEIFGLPLYTFWWVSILLFLLVLWEEENSSSLVRIVFVVLGGLSSPVIVSLLPLFYWRSYIYRARTAEHLVAFLATLIAVFQMRFIFSAGASHMPSPRSMLQHVIPKFFGSFLVGNLWHQAAWVFGMALVILIAFWIYDNRIRMSLSTSIVLPYLLAVGIALSILRIDPAIIHQKLAGPRYFFYPFVALFWILVQIGYNRNKYRHIAFAFIAIAMVNAIPVWSRSHDDLHWKDHVLSSYYFPYYTFPVQFNGEAALAWRLPLLKKEYSSYNANDRLHDFDHDDRPVFPYTLILQGSTGVRHFATGDALAYQSLTGSDYRKSIVSGFQVIGTYVTSDADKGEIKLDLHRGDCILYRSGPGNKGCRVIIDANEKRFLQELPALSDWSCLEFSNRLLPERFSARFVDEGSDFGQWFAIALKSDQESKAPGQKEIW